MSIRTPFFSLVLLLAWSLPVLAQVDTTLTLPTVTVTATRGETATAAAPARVTVLDQTAIEDAGVQNTAQLLEARTGAFIRHYGAGGLASISLRGTGAAQTLILLDGHRITDPQLGEVDLSLLPTLLFSSVELMHGAGSALYGSEGIGGVVHLRTATEAPGFTVQAGYGAFGTRSTSALLTQRWNRLTARLVADYARTAGDYPYLNTALFPARTVRRANADQERFSLYAGLHQTGARYRLQGAAWWNSADRGLPGPGTRPAVGERQSDQHLRTWLHATVQQDWGRWKIGGMWQRSRLRYVNPQLELDDTGRSTSASLDAEMDLPFGAYGLLNAGLAMAYRTARHPSLTSNAREWQAGPFLNGTLRRGGLRVYPSVRLDAYQTLGAENHTAWSPRLGLNWQPWAAHPLHLKAGTGRSFRAPTFNHRFWQPGGNPDLQPETGWTTDAGLAWHPGRVQLEVTAYTSHVRNQIVWLPRGSVWTPENVSRVRARGLEASIHGEVGRRGQRHLAGGVVYTRTDATDQTPDSRAFGHPLRYVPGHQVKTFLGLGVRRIRVDLSGRYIGRRFVTTDGRQSLDPYWTMDAQVRLRQGLRRSTLVLSLQLENLMDRAYTVIKAYPMPPRNARVQLTLQY